MKITNAARILLSLVGLTVVLKTITACDDDAEPSQVDKVWSLVQECSDSDCDINELAAEFAKLTEPNEYKKLADKSDDDYNFTLFLVKGRVYYETASMLRKFFLKSGARATAKQLKEKIGGKTAFEILRGTRPSREIQDERDQTLGAIIAASPELVNDLKLSLIAFDSEAFTRIMAKIGIDDFSTVVKNLRPANMAAWISWAAAHKTQGQPLFKKIYDQADASLKNTMVNNLWASSVANYANLRELVIDMSPGGADSWGLNNILKSKLESIVAEQYRHAATSGKKDFKKLYRVVSNSEKAIMRNTLVATAYAEGKITDVQTAVNRVATLINAKYFDEETLKLRTDAKGEQLAFSPFDPNGRQATILFAVLAQARLDNMAAGDGVLTYALVNAKGDGHGLVSALKNSFSGTKKNIRDSWRDYIEIAAHNRDTNDTQISTFDLVGADVHTRVEAAVGGVNAVKAAAGNATLVSQFKIASGVNASIKAILGKKLGKNQLRLQNAITGSAPYQGVTRLWLKYFDG